MKKKSPLDLFATVMREADRNFTSINDITDYLISDIIIEDVFPHVLIPSEINTQLTWREYPSVNFEFPEIPCERDAIHEMNRDFIDSNISADGFLMSEKAKSVFEKFDLGNHQFYEIKIIIRPKSFFSKKEAKTFYWLHLIFDETDQDYVDFPNSVFIAEASKGGKELSRTEFVFKSKEDWNTFRLDKHQKWLENSDINPFYKLRPKNLILKKGNIPDLLGLGRVAVGEKFFSRNLAIAIKENKLTGLSLKGTTMVVLEK